MSDNASLTPQEVADRLKITKNTVYELIKRGELKSYKVGRKIRIESSAIDALKGNLKKAAFSETTDNHRNKGPAAPENGFIICGQDYILDILSRHLEKHPNGLRAFRSHLGSYNGLFALYNEEVHIATSHLWDGDTGEYNVSYIRKMIPGTAVRVIRLVKRMVGFYVEKGNPQNIKGWNDLYRNDIRLINRERGCGVRVLLDEKFRLKGESPRSLHGYDDVVTSHLETASAVSRGKADFALGNEKTALQVGGIDFIPLQTECYDMAMLKENADKPPYSTIIEIIQSPGFKDEVQGLGGYDVSELGKIIL